MTFDTSSFIFPPTMKKYFTHIYAAIVITALLYAVPVIANDQIQPILTELSRPNAPLIELNEISPLDSPENNQPVAEAESPKNITVPPLFSLEELKQASTTESVIESEPDLYILDTNLPLSDIPLALNSKVEYFLYYFFKIIYWQ